VARFIVRDHPRGGRPCPPQRWREHLNAALYVLRTGCAWRHLPHDFTVSWSAAHKHFLRWCRAGVWFKALAAVRGEVRARAGRRKRPSAAMMDSSSVKASPVAGPRGFDGAKKVDGIKRHILVDTAGILIAATVTPANVQDRAAFPALLRKAKRVAPTIAHLWLDKGYTGHTVAESATQAGVSIDVVSGPKPANGFQVQPRRWVVERTNGWINHCRRLDRHYEVTLTAHEGFLYLSQIALLLRRLDRTQLFDTL
jgi:transposase